MDRFVRLGWLPLGLTFMFVSPAQAQDVLIFHNGDRLTGVVHRIERGVVTFEAPAIDGLARIGWDRVQRIDSARTFQFQTADGVTLQGGIGAPPDNAPEVFVIEGTQESLVVPQSDIIYVAQTLGPSRGLLEADVGGGFNLAKSNDQRQINGHGLVEYETPRYETSARFDSIFSTQREGNDTNRHSVTGTVGVLVAPRWRALAYTDFLTSEEQRLDRRIVVGGGPMRELVTTSQVELSVFGGAVWNNEVYTDEPADASHNQFEALAGINANLFEFKQVNFATTFLAYPSLSQSGRVRYDWRARLRLRLVRGQPFWLNVNQSYTYDTQPPSRESATDFVTSTSVSWVFP